MSELTKEDFDYLAIVLKDASGIALSEDKQYLVEARLLPVIRKRGIANLHDLAQIIRTQVGDHADSHIQTGSLLADVVEAMTTNETSFFRDTKPFDQFRQLILPEVIKQNPSGPLRFWSAASSSGQEAYTLAMCMQEEHAKWEGRELDIVGTDICHRVLQKARDGEYSQFEVQRGMPVTMLVKYFDQEKDNWFVKDPIREMVRFEYLNLMEEFNQLGRFDVVFCRNVLIYFDEQTKRDILKRMEESMKPGGFLFLGSSESVYDLSKKFKPVEGATAVFQLAS